MQHTSDYIRQIVEQVLKKPVQVEDLGWPAPGVHQFSVVVGVKPNPSYTTRPFNPATDVLDLSKQPQTIPDVRILNLNGSEDFNAIVQKIMVFRNNMPEFIAPPEIDPTIAAVNNTPVQKMYNIQPKSSDPTEAQADRDYQQAMGELQGSQLTQGVPAPNAEPASRLEEMMMTFMDTVSSNLEAMNNRINSLQAQKEASKPGKNK